MEFMIEVIYNVDHHGARVSWPQQHGTIDSEPFGHQIYLEPLWSKQVSPVHGPQKPSLHLPEELLLPVDVQRRENPG